MNTPAFRLSRLALSAAALLALPAAAQDLARDDLRVPIHTHRGGDDPTYGTWAAGPDFKASFHDGFAFYPCLGDAWPHNLPLQWRTEAVTVGGEPLPAPIGRTAVRAGPWRYEYHHLGVREAYDVRGDGVEQSFVIDAPPAVRGELRIRGRVATPLRAAPAAPAHQALVFRDDSGTGIVRYGEAFAYDAVGKRTEVVTAFDGEVVTLTVAADFVAGAIFPLTVDPLTTSLVLNTSTLGQVASTDVVVESESASRNLLFCFERAFSATDHDVYAYLAEIDFSSRVPVMSDLSTANDDRAVTTAYVAGADRFMVGFQRGYVVNGSALSTIRVYYHMRGNTGLNSGVAFSIPQLFVEFYRAPDLGGTFDGTGVHGLLAYTSDPGSGNSDHTKVVAAPINAATQQFLSAYEVGAVGVGNRYDRERPSVNQAAARGDGWVVVWQELDRQIANDDWDLYAVRTDALGQELQTSAIASGGSVHLGAPQVSGRSSEYLVTFTNSSDLSSLLSVQLNAMRLGMPPSGRPTLGPRRQVATSSPPVTFLANRGLAVNHLVNSTAVATFTRSSLLSGTSAYAVRMGGTGIGIDYHTVFSVRGQSAIAPAVTYSLANEDFPIVYGTDESASSNFLYGVRYRYPADAGEFRYGLSCGAAVIDGNRPYIGNQNYAMGLSGANPNAATALLIGTGAGAFPLDAFGMPRCWLNLASVAITLPGATDGNGRGSIALPLPDGAPPGDLFFQYLYVQPGANAANLLTTQGLRAQIR